MDWADGEVRFKTGIELTGVTPTTELVAALVQPNSWRSFVTSRAC